MTPLPDILPPYKLDSPQSETKKYGNYLPIFLKLISLKTNIILLKTTLI